MRTFYSKPAIQKFRIEIRNARSMFKAIMDFDRFLFNGFAEVMLAPSAFSPIATSIKIANRKFETFYRL